MKKVNMTIRTPRGTFKIHTEFKSEAEARENGWGVWFSHEGTVILSKENCSGAIVKA